MRVFFIITTQVYVPLVENNFCEIVNTGVDNDGVFDAEGNCNEVANQYRLDID